jgi:hypothetical protein
MTDENEKSGATFETVSRIIEILAPLNVTDREHVYRTVGMWFHINSVRPSAIAGASDFGKSTPRESRDFDDEKFSDRPVLSVKDFILEKDPLTEVERMACLAYYLTHYQETPHFKTVDLSRLNTEAAQRKFSNPAVAAGNAMRDGFFVQAPKAGYKQLSAMGERFVQLLPNRESAQQVRQRMASRRGKRAGNTRTEAKDSEAQNTMDQEI